MVDQAPTFEPPLRKKPFILFRIIQWIVAAFMVVCLLAISTEIRRLYISDAPLGHFAVTVAVVVLTALALSPPIFFRLPLILRAVAYAGMPGSIVAFSIYLSEMNPAWERTPEGKREEAQRKADAARERQIEAEATRRRVADQRQSATEAAEASKLKACKELVPDVIEMSKTGDGPEILEINDIQNTSEDSLTVECLGSFLTSRGQTTAYFELSTSPQGQKILSVRYPWGVH